MTAPVASGWSLGRVGFRPTGKRRLSRRTPEADVHRVSMTPEETSKADLQFRRKQTFVFDTRISGAVIQR